jgi:hypothetical protein
VKLLIAVAVLVLLALALLVVAGANLSDPGAAFLELLSALIIPDWNFLITLLPIALLLGLLGPIFTLIAVGWFIHYARRRTGRARIAETAPVPYSVDAAGMPLVPANRPYCPRDRLLYPAGATVCLVCRDELTVRCPIDDTTRTARQQLCRACGTRYVLGASETSITVQRRSGPPEGGAAVA